MSKNSKTESHPESAPADTVATPPTGEAPAQSPVGTRAASAESLTPENIAELQSKAAKAEENWEKYVRAYADLENFRKRAARERQDAVRYANEALLEKLIPVVDNFEAALNAAGAADNAGLESLRTGVQMIASQLKGVLKETGIEEVDATGQTFDPSLHEAVSQQETADVAEGQVVQQLRKGYKLRDRLIRPATVVVARKPSA
jgi:molecular chaperone GrpE